MASPCTPMIHAIQLRKQETRIAAQKQVSSPCIYGYFPAEQLTRFAPFRISCRQPSESNLQSIGPRLHTPSWQSSSRQVDTVRWGSTVSKDAGARRSSNRRLQVAAAVKQAPAKVVQVVIEERMPDGTIRQYIADDISGEVQIAKEPKGQQQEERLMGKHLQLGPLVLPRSVQAFVLPAGFPQSVAPEYLRYMLWQLPVHVTGWACSTLVTSTLFKAVGIGASPGTAAAASAAAKWVTKDGLGAVGRLLIGGRFGALFDEDPKQWRMYADVIGSGGSLFELATPLLPGSFLLLASLGHLTKAFARGLKDPSWRVIQAHFAAAENMGEVTAKEEVWEVVGQLEGLALGVLLLDTPGVQSSYWTLTAVWAALRAIHLYLRYRSLELLRLPTLNFKRAAILVQAHTAGLPLPDVEGGNALEQVMQPRQWMSPRMHLGCSLEQLVGPAASCHLVQALLEIYRSEEYVLVLAAVAPGGKLEARIAFKEAASSLAMLRSMWQAQWLLSRKARPPTMFSAPAGGENGIDTESLRASVAALNKSFRSFLGEAEEKGWNCSRVVMRPPPDAPFLLEGTGR